MDKPKLLAQLLDSPIAKQLLGDEQKRLAAERTRLSNALADLDRKHEVAFPPLIAAVVAAETLVTEARTALRRAEAKLSKAWQAQVGASLAHADARTALEQQLRATADPAIATFIRAKRQEMDAVRKAEMPATLSRAQLDLLQWAVREAEKLQLQPAADVGAALTRLTEEIATELAKARPGVSEPREYRAVESYR